MYDMKALYEATSVENAVALRLEHPEAQIIAGGSDVLVQMREGKRAGAELISIYGLDELRGVRMDEDENIRIGSLTSFSHITRDPIIQKYINVLGEAVDMVGGPQIRNIGTIGGNTCNGVTSADSSSTLHAWDAIVELTGKNGVRRLPIHEFYIKAGTVDIRVECDKDESCTMTVSAAVLNGERFVRGYEILSASQLNLTKFRSTLVEGTINCNRDGLLYTSVPQNGNWSVRVDAESAEVTPLQVLPPMVPALRIWGPPTMSTASPRTLIYF